MNSAKNPVGHLRSPARSSIPNGGEVGRPGTFGNSYSKLLDAIQLEEYTSSHRKSNEVETQSVRVAIVL
jgi:hypothetical protein